MAEDKYKEKPRVEATGSPEQVAKLKAQVNDVKKTLRATDIKFRRIGGGGGAGATSDRCGQMTAARRSGG